MIINKQQLQDNIRTEINDNSTGQISPNDIRHNLLDIIDSVNDILNPNRDIHIKDLISNNFSTPAGKNVRAGLESLAKLHLPNYQSVDNTAFGYYALHNSYQSSGNVALGSHSLSCTTYGSNNSAIGYDSLGGNVNGFGNVGIGSYTFRNNKYGHFNIAIGNAAGYYVDKNTHRKLIISSHDVDSDYICANPEGSGLVPLIHGDMSTTNLVLGIATRDLLNSSFGLVQTSGSIIPRLDSTFNLGHSSYSWDHLYAKNINFGNSIFSSTGSSILSSGNIIPFHNEQYNLGSVVKPWLEVHTRNLHVSGVARLESLIATQAAHYLTKTIHLASSGTFDTIDGGSVSGLQFNVLFDPELDHPQGYLADANLSNAGLILRASGLDHVDRQYEFIFQPSGNNLLGLEKAIGTDTTFTRSTWNSNVSLHLGSGCHVKTNRVLGSGDLALLTWNDCYGLYIESGNSFYGYKEAFMNSGDFAGVGDFNIVGASGSYGAGASDYVLTVSNPESGYNVAQRFLTGTMNRVVDSSNSNKDKLQGFEIKYFDHFGESYTGQKPDRLLFSSFDDNSHSTNHMTFMKNGIGVLGVNNFNTNSAGASLLPETLLNIRSKDKADLRVTAESTNGKVESSLQLVARNNCLDYGLEAVYRNISGVADFNIYESASGTTAMRINSSGDVGILCSGDLASYLTVGDSGHPSGIISLHMSPSNPIATSGYGKLFVKEKMFIQQSQDLFFMDDSGNVHSFTRNPLASNDGLIYDDIAFNVLGGSGCTRNRAGLTTAASGNTGYGRDALHYLASGDHNTVVGYSTASGINNGSFNTIVGSLNCPTLSSGDGNIVIGYSNTLNLATNDSLHIGNYLPILEDNSFALGSGSNAVLMSGIISSTNPFVEINNRLSVHDTSRKNYLDITNDTIDFVEYDTNSPQDSLTLRFTGSGAMTSGMNLMEFNHSGVPMSGVEFSPTFQSVSPARPYVSVSGDLHLLGALRLRNGDSLENVRNITNSGIFLEYQVSESGRLLSASGQSVSGQLYHRTNSLHVEGHMISDAANAGGFDSPTVAQMRVANYNPSVTSETYLSITNRDQYSSLKTGDYVIAIRIERPDSKVEYRPIWISNKDLACGSCCK